MSIPPSNIKRNLIYQTINRHDLEYICEREWVLVLRMVCHGKKDDNDSEIKPQACTEISYEWFDQSAPIFDDSQFEQTFVRGGKQSWFILFADSWLHGELGKCLLVKFLAAQKLNCHDISFVFCNYFQTGERTVCLCMLKLLHWILDGEEISGCYLRLITSEVAYWFFVGTLALLSCWSWGTILGKGRFLNDLWWSCVDLNLWFWRSVFGCTEYLNDISIWDHSLLYKSTIDVSHCKIDSPLVAIAKTSIKNQDYNLLWIESPITLLFSSHNQWSIYKIEGWKRSIQRAFGV